jgi:organic hydroperoxide reductase OsmC/OhrA
LPSSRFSPPEFKGEPNIWAPEELLVGSLNTCMMLTFLTLAQAQGLTPVGYESEAEGLLENVEGKYHITEVTVRPRVTLKSETELEPARKSMESVEPTASSQIRLTPGSSSRRSLSLLPHQSENVPLSREHSIVWKAI